MASPFKIIGYGLQIAGMAIMFFAFINLVTGIQHTVGSVTQMMSAESGVLKTHQNSTACDPETDELCGVDFTDEQAMQQVMSKRVNDFITYLGLGLALMFVGLMLRAGEEIGGFITGLKSKEPARDRLRIPVGKLRWGDF